MSLDQERRDFALRAQARGWRSLFAPRWLLRLQLRSARLAIERLEQELGDEFATLATAPLHEELSALVVERDALLKRLAERR